jgi:hypothetical protein
VCTRLSLPPPAIWRFQQPLVGLQCVIISRETNPSSNQMTPAYMYIPGYLCLRLQNGRCQQPLVGLQRFIISRETNPPSDHHETNIYVYTRLSLPPPAIWRFQQPLVGLQCFIISRETNPPSNHHDTNISGCLCLRLQYGHSSNPLWCCNISSSEERRTPPSLTRPFPW